MSNALREMQIVRADGMTETEMQDFLFRLQYHHRDACPIIPYSKIGPIATAMGTCALSVPDPWKPYQFSWPNMYVGITTAEATSEKYHSHPVDTTEIYLVVDGQAEITSRHFHEREWQTRRVGPGDIAIASFGAIHFWQWTSRIGFAWVLKSPPRAGVGKPPFGKLLFEESCQNGSLFPMPPGYSPQA